VKLILLFFLLGASLGCLGQIETLPVPATEVTDDPSGTSDTLSVEERRFDQSRVDSFKNDPEFQYEQPPTIAESLWDRFLMWLNELLRSFFDGAVTTDWGRVISYILGLAVLVIVIMAILKVDAFKVFYSAQGANPIKHEVLDENIHEIDFDREIQLALDQKDYRRGIRLLFLFALKILSDQHLINWEQGKTNHDYVSEVQEEAMRNWLRQLSYYFDYAWYGNFVVSREMFDRVNNVFASRKTGRK
jgi:hypothetical protein